MKPITAKVSKTFRVRNDDVDVLFHVEGLAEYHCEMPSWTCPGGETFDVIELTSLMVEFENKPCRYTTIEGDWHEQDILAYCRAWGVDPYEMAPEDMEQE